MTDTTSRCVGVHVDHSGGGWLCDAPTDGAPHRPEHEGGTKTHETSSATLWAVRWMEAGVRPQFRQCKDEDEARRLFDHLHARTAGRWAEPQLLSASIEWAVVQ